MGGEVRWINFVIPGFDDLDERRGDYSGSVQDFCKLIILILKKRGVKEFIYCGFSGGSYNVAVMYHLYPNLMIGEINLVGCGYTWPVGLMLSAKLIVNDSGFGFGPRGIE
jgi:pimeloyl-ACP methyl ester carboxylesterase